MKKVVLTLLMAALAASMAACGTKEETAPDTSKPVDEVSIPQTAPETADEKAYIETVVSIEAGDHQIPATICVPNTEGKHPAVVMLHGTGSKRDEVNDSYTYAAKVLAEKYGIATVRIDFMGSGDSTEDYTRYTFKSAAEDAAAAANHMAGLENIDKDKIGVMGWSQGGKDALLSAAWNPELFKAVVTWAGAPDMSASVTDEEYAQAKENGYFVKEFDWREPLHVSLQWCDDVKNTDVLKEFSAYTGPVLAVQGTEDTAVDPKWAEKIVEANPDKENSKTFMIEGMDHTFNTFSEPEKDSLNKAIDATGQFFTDMLK